MAWTELVGAAPIVHVRDDGTIMWNAATHAMLGNPIAIEMFHDANAGKLGFRGVSWHAPLFVRTTDEYQYVIGANEHLDLAGLKPVVDWSAVPQAPDEVDPPDPGELDVRDIVWIAIP